MFTKKYRPTTIGQLYGQEENALILRSLIKTPAKFPRSLIFQGEYGCGKTSSARILARGLNCKAVSGERPCGECIVCKDPLTFSPFYQEFDSSTVGNKGDMEKLKTDFFSSSVSGLWRVIVLDEAHLITRSAQGSLLKILEELPENIYVVLCTTDIKDIRYTVRSRSVDLNYRKVPIDLIEKNLKRIVKAENEKVSDEVISSIARYSKGHVRDSVMALNMYCNVDDKVSFFSKIKSSEKEILSYLYCVVSGKGDVVPLIENICKRPLGMVKDDFYWVLRNLVMEFGGGNIGELYKEDYRRISSILGQGCLTLFSLSLGDWVVNSFANDVTAQGFFWALKCKFLKKVKPKTGNLERFKRG